MKTFISAVLHLAFIGLTAAFALRFYSPHPVYSAFLIALDLLFTFVTGLNLGYCFHRRFVMRELEKLSKDLPK